jgi:3-oxoacyl-[acyl-carrier protein] reductase
VAAADGPLKGRTALVTGGSKGLGFAMGRALAGAGACVVLVARTPADLDRAAAALADDGAAVRTFACDVSDPGAVEQLVRSLEDQPVDILINNAGESRALPFEQATDTDWQTDIDQKLMAAVRLCRAFLPGMRERRWGRVINVLNVGAKAPGAESMPTSVTRAAGMALTKALSKEYAPHNVLVNAINIGLIESDQWRRRHAALVARAEQAGDEEGAALDYGTFLERMGTRVPLGRVGEADEAGRLALFLASDDAAFITGTAINLDGGMAATV